MSGGPAARNIVLFLHYFPPMNASGGKRMEAMSKYFSRAGRNVTVLTTPKSEADGCDLTETMPEGPTIYEINWRGRLSKSRMPAPNATPYRQTRSAKLLRRVKDVVMSWFGQLPDPRLPFAFAFLSPFMAPQVRAALRDADVLVATSPPWAPMLGALFAKWRFGKPLVLDYRDQFSLCHEMPGGPLAKRLELATDRFLTARAAAVVAISEPMARYYSGMNARVTAIPNGYDSERVDEVARRGGWTPRPPAEPLRIRYLGMTKAGRIPRRLLAALVAKRALLDQGGAIFEYYGHPQLLSEVIEREYPMLAPFFRFLPGVPYIESLELMATADHLLFCENGVAPRPGREASASGILTTKLFEYLASRRPVIADISPQTLAATFIARASPAHFVSDSVERFEAFLESDRFLNPAPVEINSFVRSLSRAAQANDYLGLLDEIAAEHRREENEAARPA